MIKRHITARVLEALADTPVVLLNGPRQAGKSTLAQEVASHEHPARYLTLDDATTLAAARNDPPGFLAGFEGPVVIDEIQRAPELFLAIKAQVDRDRRPGRFLLTGSSDVLLLPNLAESFAGRMEILTLWPFSQGEIEKNQEDFIDFIFSQKIPRKQYRSLKWSDMIRKILRGGYPEILGRQTEARQAAWFGSYITTILQRDVRDITHIEGLTALPRLLALLAALLALLPGLARLRRGAALAVLRRGACGLEIGELPLRVASTTPTTMHRVRARAPRPTPTTVRRVRTRAPRPTPMRVLAPRLALALPFAADARRDLRGRALRGHASRTSAATESVEPLETCGVSGITPTTATTDGHTRTFRRRVRAPCTWF